MSDMRRALVTPEGVDLGVTLADAGMRAAAFLLDLCVIGGILIVMTLVAAFGLTAAPWGPVGIIWLLGFFALRNFYFIAMELRPRGSTFGKRWMGLRVVARDGGRLTADAVVARNLLREIEIFLPLYLLGSGIGGGWPIWLAGFVWSGVFLFFPLFNRDRLRVGDLLAGTWVIRTRRDKLAREIRAIAPEFTFSPAQLEAYGVYELETLEAVLRRSDPKARQTVAQTISLRIGWSQEIRDVDAFLIAYYEQLRTHLEARVLLGRRRADKFDVAA